MSQDRVFGPQLIQINTAFEPLEEQLDLPAPARQGQHLVNWPDRVRNDLLIMASQSGGLSLSDPAIRAILEDIEGETTILKRDRKKVAFAHATFRDILVAEYLAERLRDGSVEEIRLGLEVGSLVTELLEGESYPYDKPQEIPQSMAYIQAGPFIVGDGPETQIKNLPNSFYIGKYPVTNGEFRDFVETGGYENDR